MMSHRAASISHQFDPNRVVFVEAVAIHSGVDGRRSWSSWALNMMDYTTDVFIVH